MAQDIISQFRRAYPNPIETTRKVATIVARDSIPSGVRWQGMLVFVVEDLTTYELNTGVTNTDWIALKSQVDIVVEDNLTSTSTVNALSSNQGRILDETKIPDAPADTFEYVRKDNAWVLNTGGSGLSSDDIDTLAELNSIVTDATLIDTTDFRLSNARTPTAHTHVNTDITDLASFTGFDARYYTETEIDSQASAYELIANKGSANGYVPLNGSSLIDSVYLPSYVDDVLEFANLGAFPGTGETGKIYIALDTNTLYRWSGSVYVEVSGTSATSWGSITGTLSNQTDLQSALDGKSNTGHTHLIADITDFTDNSTNWNDAFSWGNHASAGYLTSFTETNDLTSAVTWANVPIANIPTGTTGVTVALGNHLHTGVYEPVDATIVRTGDASYNATEWDIAYNDKINSASFSTGTGVLTLTQQDAGTVTVNLDGRYLTTETDSQTLTWTDGTNNLAISGGNSVTITGFADSTHTHLIADVTDFTDNSTNWNTAYNDKINSASFNVSNGVLTLTQQDATTITVDLDGRYVENIAYGTSGQVPYSSGSNFSYSTGLNWNNATSTLELQGILVNDITPTFPNMLVDGDTGDNLVAIDPTSGILKEIAIGSLGLADSSHTHVTADITNLSSYTGLDGRYYTESEVNTFLGDKVDVAGDTMTGNLTFNSNVGVILSNDVDIYSDGSNYVANLLTTGDFIWNYQTAERMRLDGGTGNLTVMGDIVTKGGANGMQIWGATTGVTNTAWVSFYEINGTTRQGYVGVGSTGNDDMYLTSDVGNINFAYGGSTYVLEGASGNRFGTVPVVRSDGVMEIGNYIDFHTSDGDTGDYTGGRIQGTAGSFIFNQQIQTTGNEVQISGNSPRIDFIETGGTNNWNIIVDADDLDFRRSGTSNTQLRLKTDGTNQFYNRLTISGNNIPIVTQGTGTGTSSQNYFLARDSVGTNMWYLGIASTGNNTLLLNNYYGGNYLALGQSGGESSLTYYTGSVTREVYHEGNLSVNSLSQKVFQTTGYGTGNIGKWTKIATSSTTAFQATSVVLTIVGSGHTDVSGEPYSQTVHLHVKQQLPAGSDPYLQANAYYLGTNKGFDVGYVITNNNPLPSTVDFYIQGLTNYTTWFGYINSIDDKNKWNWYNSQSLLTSVSGLVETLATKQLTVANSVKSGMNPGVLKGSTTGTYTVTTHSVQWYQVAQLVMFTITLGGINGSTPTGNLQYDLTSTGFPSMVGNYSFSIQSSGNTNTFYSKTAVNLGAFIFEFTIQNLLDGANTTKITNTNFGSGNMIWSGCYITS